MCVTNQGSPRIFIFFSFTLLPALQVRGGGGEVGGALFADLSFVLFLLSQSVQQRRRFSLCYCHIFFFFSFPFSLSYPAKRQ